jgi:hypothetical protein
MALTVMPQSAVMAVALLKKEAGEFPKLTSSLLIGASEAKALKRK